jgi:hypothetical protein
LQGFGGKRFDVVPLGLDLPARACAAPLLQIGLDVEGIEAARVARAVDAAKANAHASSASGFPGKAPMIACALAH